VQANGGLSGQIISRGNIISLIEPSGNLDGLVAAQGNIGTFFTPSTGTPIRLGGVSVGTLSGRLLSLGSIIGDVTISGGLVGGRIAAQVAILGNLTVYGSIDSNSAVVSGGSVGSTVYGTKLTCGNIFGIVAAVGPINVGNIGTTSTARYFKQNDGQDTAVIDALFSQGVNPLSAADVFDQSAPGDLLNLDQMILSLSGAF
jgi:hypothetical protein